MKNNEDGSIEFDSWPLGQDNVSADFELDPEVLRSVVNADITNKGKIVRNQGYQKVYSGANVHSLWGIPGFPCGFVVDNGTLYALDPELNKAPIIAVDAARRMSYRALNDRVYFSNGAQSGYLTSNGDYWPWQVECPIAAPQCAASATGGLDAGQYQVSCQFRRRDGWLSGAPLAVSAIVQTGGGIDLSNIPQPKTAEIDTVRLYVSHANGDQLYHYVDLPVGVTTHKIVKRDLGRILNTQFLNPLPAGKHIAFYRGRWYVSVSSVLFFSESLNFGLYRPKKNFFVFPDPIVLVEPVDNGLFVATTHRHYFLSGNDALDMTQQELLQVGAVERSVITPEMTGNETEGPIWIVQELGYVEGGSGGQIKPITRHRLSIPTVDEAASLFRKRPGINQIVTSMSGIGGVAHGAASDAVEVEVIRNGILLQ